MDKIKVDVHTNNNSDTKISYFGQGTLKITNSKTNRRNGRKMNKRYKKSSNIILNDIQEYPLVLFLYTYTNKKTHLT